MSMLSTYSLEALGTQSLPMPERCNNENPKPQTPTPSQTRIRSEAYP